MDTTHWRIESYEGLDILIGDYGGCKTAEFVRRLHRIRDYIVTQPERSVLMISLTGGVEYSPEAVTTAVSVMKDIKPYVRASCVVGLAHLTPLIRVLNHLSGRDVNAFDDLETAKRWIKKTVGK